MNSEGSIVITREKSLSKLSYLVRQKGSMFALLYSIQLNDV